MFGGNSCLHELFQPIPLFCLAGEHTSLWARSPEAGSTERRRNPKQKNPRIQGGVWSFFFCFSRWSPIGILAGDFAMDFGIGRVAQQTSRHVVEGGRSPRRKQSLDASSRSSWDDETRGPGLPGVTPTGSQNPCTHRISEFWFPDFLQQIAGLDLHGVQVSPLVWPQILELQNLQIHGRCCQVDDLLDGWDTNGWQCFSSSNLACAENLPKATKRKLLIFTNQHPVASCGRPHGSRGGTGSFFLMQPQRYEQWHSGSLPS